MDYSTICTLGDSSIASGILYQAATPDDQITQIGHRTMLIEMAAGIDALRWVKTGSLKCCLYFGIDDAPNDCLPDEVLLSLGGMARMWMMRGGDIVSGCGAGISRSSYASCAIIMMIKKVTFDQALTIVRSGRPQANPNYGFVEQLQRLQPRLMME